MIAYKIVEKVENGYKFLFHNRRNILKEGDVFIAEKKMVYESYDKLKNKKLYLSGIHVVQTEKLCRKYLKKFKRKDNKTIIACEAFDVSKKLNGNEGVLLADKIIILNELK
jgi:hypothetical protein